MLGSVGQPAGEHVHVTIKRLIFGFLERLGSVIICLMGPA